MVVEGEGGAGRIGMGGAEVVTCVDEEMRGVNGW